MNPTLFSSSSVAQASEKLRHLQSQAVEVIGSVIIKKRCGFTLIVSYFFVVTACLRKA